MELTDSFLLSHSTEIRLALGVFACVASYVVIQVASAVSSAISALSTMFKTAAPGELNAAAAR